MKMKSDDERTVARDLSATSQLMKKIRRNFNNHDLS